MGLRGVVERRTGYKLVWCVTVNLISDTNPALLVTVEHANLMVIFDLTFEVMMLFSVSIEE